MPVTQIYACDTVDQRNKAVISEIVDKATAAIQHHGTFHLALAGGSGNPITTCTINNALRNDCD